MEHDSLHRRSRLVTHVLLALMTALLLVACGGKRPASLAQDALDAGLQAQIAGDLETAKTRYAECLQHEPANTHCLFNSGLIAQTEGRMADAEDAYRLALTVDPVFASPLLNLAIVLTPSAPEEAIELYRRYLEQSPGDAGAHLNLGLLLRSQGDEAGAQEHFGRVRELDPALVIPEPTAS